MTALDAWETFVAGDGQPAIRPRSSPAADVEPDVEPHADMVGECDGCGRHRPIVAGILLLETGDQEPEDLGFCSLACMVVVVRRRWMEAR